MDPLHERLMDMLRELVPIPAISSYEEPMIRWCRDRFSAIGAEVTVDVRGNVTARFPGGGGPRLMLAAHMDTIGLIVKSIDDRGFVRFSRSTLPLTHGSRRVLIHGAKGPVLGVIGTRVGYSTSTTEELTTAVSEAKLYIDIGCYTAAEVAALGVSVGDPITFCEPPQLLGSGTAVISPYLDDRAGIALLVLLAERIAARSRRTEVLLVASIEEELGLRGVGTVAERVCPDLGISVDTQPAGGTPEYDFHTLPVLIGRGPVIKFTENGKATVHPRVRKLLVSAAQRAGTDYQMAAAPPGGSDMQAIEQAAGIPSGALGLPRRYAHSPNEVVDLRDLSAMLEILDHTVDLLDAGYDLNRI